MAILQERYTPVTFAANGTYNSPSGNTFGIAGFLCVTTGTLTVTRPDGSVVVNAFPVTGGVYHPMPFYVGSGGTVTLAGGASGTLAIS